MKASSWALCALALTLTTSPILGAGTARAQVAADAPTPGLVHPLFQDHAVLQRDQPIPVWGWVKPKATVTVLFLDHDYKAKADKTGAWRLDLPATPAGGPYDLAISSDDGQSATIKDVLIGDVFLCGGQSNMQFMVRQTRNFADEIARSGNDRIRLLQVERRNSAVARAVPASKVAWTAAGPQTVPDFSAVCYYFGREIEKTHKVPVGLIHSSWGGSMIQDWLPADGLRKVGGFDANLALLDAYAKDPKAAAQTVFDGTATWATTNDPGTKENWAAPAFDDSAWGTINLPRVWEEQGRPDLVDLDGVVWLRKHVILTADQAAKGATLNLGTVDERDTTFVNGTKVGENLAPQIDRAYAVAPELLKAGDNVIAVRVVDEGGGGGLRSSTDRVFWTVTGGDKLPLNGDWLYRISGDFHKGLPHPPYVPWVATRGNTTLYNGMIAPLESYAYKGVLWFQGEQNIGEGKLYARLLPGLIDGWRARFRQDLPFLIVQLTNYGPMSDVPVESGFADIRDVQRRTAKVTPKTGLAVAIDLGNPRDIHSPEKQEVARRLVLEAERVIYGRNDIPASPLPLSASREGATVRIRFENTGKGLISYSGPAVLGFELCPQTGTCTFATARVDGDSVLIDAAAQPNAVSVRYAWAGTPVVNLYNRDGLPASPFQIDITQAR